MASIDLTDLDAVRRYLQRADPSADEQDPVIQDLITSYSRSIIREYREFAPASDGVARTFEINPNERVHTLAPFDCRAATKAVLDLGKGYERVLDSTEWTLALLDPENQVWQAVELALPVATGLLEHGRTLTITGDWGFSAVPEDVELACRMAVVMSLRGDVQGFGSALQPNSFGEGSNDGNALPPGIRGLLNGFRRTIYV